MSRCLSLLVLVAVAILAPSLLGQSAAPEAHIVLTKLGPIAYPQIARTAHISGDVEIEVGVKRDGSQEFARVVSGPPLLIRAALQSAQQSQFQCRNCADAVTAYRVTYTFNLIVTEGKCPDDCNRTGPEPVQPAPTVKLEGSHVTLTNYVYAPCICDGFRKVRKLKCFYLWRCGF